MTTRLRKRLAYALSSALVALTLAACGTGANGGAGETDSDGVEDNSSPIDHSPGSNTDTGPPPSNSDAGEDTPTPAP
jgi:hypothetical protein